VNPHGDPLRDNPTVEWEGKANRVALHAPYILLFDPRFIEIRHVETGRLSQIIQGLDVRCIWDGRGVDPSPEVITSDGGDDNVCQEPKIHAVMNGSEPQFPSGSRPSRATFQRVFELIPTLPLYLPGPITSPAPAAAYFPASFSPPRSPPWRATIHRS